MKQLLGLKKHRKCEAIGGKEYATCYTRGGWTHGDSECWLKASQRADGSCYEYDMVNYLTGELVECQRERATTTTCEKCGATLRLGDFPFCPHGRYRGNTESDGIPGGETLENVGPEPVTFYSRSEKRRYLKEHGLIEMVRHVPVPGSDRSPHTTSWTGVDLEAGRILAERQATTKATTKEYRPNPETIAIIKQVTAEHYARHGRD